MDRNQLPSRSRLERLRARLADAVVERGLADAEVLDLSRRLDRVALAWTRALSQVDREATG